MASHEIKPNIYYVGAKDYDRRLFDELIPLPDGTTYNSYLVIGSKKTALIDTVDATKFHELKKNLAKTPVKTIDYLVSNHTEQDHSESLVKLIKMYPEAKVVTNPKGKEHLKGVWVLGADGKEKIRLLKPEYKFRDTPREYDIIED